MVEENKREYENENASENENKRVKERKVKEYRVIFRLANGKRKYATHNGKVLLWDDYDLLALRRNFVDYEQFAYTEDFEHFAFSSDELARAFPSRKIVRVIGFRAESTDVPLNSKVIV